MSETRAERLLKAAKAEEESAKAVLAAIAELTDNLADAEAATDLANILSEKVLPVFETASLLSEIFTLHEADVQVMLATGNAMEAARDIDDLNAPPPDKTLFANMVRRLAEIQLAMDNPYIEAKANEALAATARLMARQRDDIAERAYARNIELFPEGAWAHYSQGLFFKTRGRFAEGVVANQKALALAKEPDEATQWNLGICATGAGQAEIALEVWKSLGNKLEIGRFDLPDGGYPSCKVRLAERPLAERDSGSDDPGLEETIWVQRLSPCHGIIRSVLYEDLGVDFGDVVLFDGAPITYQRYGDQQIAVFPHLATLRRSGYSYYDFSATQLESQAVANVSDQLAQDAVIYSHTESFVLFCATCWRDENVQHERHETEEHNVVHGRIAAPPELGASDLLAQIDTALADLPGTRLFSPDLCHAAGQTDRAQLEERRYVALRGT